MLERQDVLATPHCTRADKEKRQEKTPGVAELKADQRIMLLVYSGHSLAALAEQCRPSERRLSVPSGR